MQTNITISILLLLVSAACNSMAQKQDVQPNIVLIVADDLGWKDVGYNGAKFYETPNIDRLAGEGILFDRYYAPAANCAPSRACMLTGMYTPRHSVYVPQGLSRGGEVSDMRWKVPTQDQDSTFNTFPVSINTVAPRFESIAEVLNKAGYATGRFGKWHIGDDNQGFACNTANGNMGYTFNRNGDEGRLYKDVHVAEKLTDATLRFIEENKDTPFFAYLAHWEVHTPLKAREERIRYFKEKQDRLALKNVDPVYAAEIEQVDLSVGRINAKLKELGLDKNTVVIFTSDNGGVSGVTSNAPLRAGKGTYYEGGIRVPFCMKYPKLIRAGSRSGEPVCGIDLMPTFAELSGGVLPKQQPVDGHSILSLCAQGNSIDRSLFFHFPLYLGKGEDAVLPSFKGKENTWRAVPSTTVIKNDWKLIYYYEYDRYELFNLKNDSSELNDLSATEQETGKALLRELKNWVKEVGAPVPNVLNK